MGGLGSVGQARRGGVTGQSLGLWQLLQAVLPVRAMGEARRVGRIMLELAGGCLAIFTPAALAMQKPGWCWRCALTTPVSTSCDQDPAGVPRNTAVYVDPHTIHPFVNAFPVSPAGKGIRSPLGSEHGT